MDLGIDNWSFCHRCRKPLGARCSKPPPASEAVVATHVDGIVEIVEHGETGLLVPPRSADALALAIHQLLENPSMREDMGRRGRQKVESHLSWKANAHATKKVYESIAARVPSGFAPQGESSP